MKRMHLIEIADLAWRPRGIRHGVSDYCRFLGRRGRRALRFDGGRRGT